MNQPSAPGISYPQLPNNVPLSNRPQFDEKSYLRSIFNDIDTNKNGSLNAQELHEALRKGQPISQFDYNTVVVLLQKYDK